MSNFWDRPEWLELRFRILRQHGYKCMACGVTRETRPGVVLQVDHIKPRSIYPELALVADNLQVLCRECNVGKSNKYSDDLRPKIVPKKRVRSPFRSLSTNRRLGLVWARYSSWLKGKLAKAEATKDQAAMARWMRVYLDIQRNMKNVTDIPESA